MSKNLILVLAITIMLAACEPMQANTPDIYFQAQQAQATSAAAQKDSEFYGRMLTGTAEAPIIHITETAAAVEVMRVYWTATAQQAATMTAAPMTQTAQAWTPTPNATSTHIAAQSELETTAMANQTRRDELALKREGIQNEFKAALPAVVLVVICCVLAWALLTQSRRERVRPIQRDARGDAPLLEDVVTGEIIDPDSNPNYSTGHSKSDIRAWLESRMGVVPQLPAVTAERQDAVKERDQLIDTARVHANKTIAPATNKYLPEPEAIGATGNNGFELPNWSILDGWNPKDGLPYYTGDGLKMIDTERYPHIAVIGMTGWGKSRRFIRPLIACILASGYRVLVIGKSADYWPFNVHTNFHLLNVSRITEPAQADKYAATLKSIVQEMNRRDDFLTASKCSTWTHAGRPLTFVVLDELGNALSQLKADAKAQSIIWVTALVREGRKAGFNIILANQRATGMAEILSQTGKAIFYVERDEEKAHHSLRGASDLDVGYFLAKFGASRLAGAFDPSDAELTSFIRTRQVPALEREDWIDGELITPPQIQTGAAPLILESKPEPEPEPEQTYEEIAIEDRIATTWMNMRDSHTWKGLNDFERTIYGEVKNGARQVKIKHVIAEVQGWDEKDVTAEIEKMVTGWSATTPGTTNATTTPKMPENPDFLAGMGIVARST
jgi:hypothetical protein